MAVAAALLLISKGVNPGKVMADLYETGVEAGKDAVLADPQSFELIGRVA
jgi:hypothetical protein